MSQRVVGRLMDSAGLPLSGANDLRVSLYDASSGGVAIWSQDFTSYSFDNGYFSVELNSIPDGVLDGDLWVGVAVNGGADVGRQPVVSVPFARRADTATNVSGGSVDASEIRVNGNLVIDGSGNLAAGQTLAGLSCSADQFAVYNGSAWSCAVATGLLDGDDDTLAALPCSDGQLARFQLATTSWVCSTDLTLDEAAVDAMVSNNGYLSSADVAAVAISGAYADLSGLPALATVASSGDYLDLVNTPMLATVASSGDYLDLVNTPSLAAVASSGAYADLSGVPALAAVASSGAYADLSGTPSLAAVGTSGAYADLSGTPTLAAVGTSGAYADLSGTPTLAAVATSGDYADLINLPTRFDGSVQARANASCLAIKQVQPGARNGTYWVDENADGDTSDAVQVYCDMAFDGGGWTTVANTLLPDNDNVVRVAAPISDMQVRDPSSKNLAIWTWSGAPWSELLVECRPAPGEGAVRFVFVKDMQPPAWAQAVDDLITLGDTHPAITGTGGNQRCVVKHDTGRTYFCGDNNGGAETDWGDGFQIGTTNPVWSGLLFGSTDSQNQKKCNVRDAYSYTSGTGSIGATGIYTFRIR